MCELNSYGTDRWKSYSSPLNYNKIERHLLSSKQMPCVGLFWSCACTIGRMKAKFAWTTSSSSSFEWTLPREIISAKASNNRIFLYVNDGEIYPLKITVWDLEGIYEGCTILIGFHLLRFVVLLLYKSRRCFWNTLTYWRDELFMFLTI